MVVGDRSRSLGSLVNCSAIVTIIWKPNFHFASDRQWLQRSRSLRENSLVSIWSLTIVTIAGIVAIAENIRSLWSSQLLKFDFHSVAGIVQIAGHIRSLWSSRSLRSLCYGFHMITGIVTIVTIAAVAALVVSINFLRSLTIVHDRYDRRDRLWFYPSDRDRCDRWQSLGSLAIAGKMKLWFPYDRYDRWTLY